MGLDLLWIWIVSLVMVRGLGSLRWDWLVDYRFWLFCSLGSFGECRNLLVLNNEDYSGDQ